MESDVSMLDFDSLPDELRSFLLACSIDDLERCYGVEHQGMLNSEESQSWLCQNIGNSRQSGSFNRNWQTGLTLEGSTCVKAVGQGQTENGSSQDISDLPDKGIFGNRKDMAVSGIPSTHRTVTRNQPNTVDLENHSLHSEMDFGDRTHSTDTGGAFDCDILSVCEENAGSNGRSPKGSKRNNATARRVRGKKKKISFPKQFLPWLGEISKRDKAESHDEMSGLLEQDGTALPQNPPRDLQVPFKVQQCQDKCFILPFDEEREHRSECRSSDSSDEFAHQIAKVLSLHKCFKAQSQEMMDKLRRMKLPHTVGKLKTRQGEFQCNHNYLRKKSVRQILQDIGTDFEQESSEGRQRLPVGKPAHKRKNAFNSDESATCTKKRKEKEREEILFEKIQPNNTQKVSCITPKSKDLCPPALSTQHNNLAGEFVKNVENCANLEAEQTLWIRVNTQKNFATSDLMPSLENQNPRPDFKSDSDEGGEINEQNMENQMPVLEQYDIEVGVDVMHDHESICRRAKEMPAEESCQEVAEVPLQFVYQQVELAQRQTGVENKQEPPQEQARKGKILGLAQRPNRTKKTWKSVQGQSRRENKQEIPQKHNRTENTLAQGHSTLENKHSPAQKQCRTVNGQWLVQRHSTAENKQRLAQCQITAEIRQRLAQGQSTLENKHSLAQKQSRTVNEQGLVQGHSTTESKQRLAQGQSERKSKQVSSQKCAWSKNNLSYFDAQKHIEQVTDIESKEQASTENSKGESHDTEHAGSYVHNGENEIIIEQGTYFLRNRAITSKTKLPIQRKAKGRQKQTGNFSKRRLDAQQNKTRCRQETTVSDTGNVHYDGLQGKLCHNNNSKNASLSSQRWIYISRNQKCSEASVQPVSTGIASDTTNLLEIKTKRKEGVGIEKGAEADHSDSCEKSPFSHTSLASSPTPGDQWSVQSVGDEESTIAYQSDGEEDTQASSPGVEGYEQNRKSSGSNTNSELIFDHLPVVEKQGKFISADAISDGNVDCLYQSPFILFVHKSAETSDPSGSSKQDVTSISPLEQAAERVPSDKLMVENVENTVSPGTDCIDDDGNVGEIEFECVIPNVVDNHSLEGDACHDKQLLKTLLRGSVSDWVGQNPSGSEQPTIVTCSSCTSSNCTISVSPPVISISDGYKSPVDSHSYVPISCENYTVTRPNFDDAVSQRTCNQCTHSRESSSLQQLLEILEESTSSLTLEHAPEKGQPCSTISSTLEKPDDTSLEDFTTVPVEDSVMDVGDNFVGISEGNGTMLSSVVLPDVIEDVAGTGLCLRDLSSQSATSLVDSCIYSSALPDLLVDTSCVSTGHIPFETSTHVENVKSTTSFNERVQIISGSLLTSHHCNDTEDVLSRHVSSDYQSEDKLEFPSTIDLDELTPMLFPNSPDPGDCDDVHQFLPVALWIKSRGNGISDRSAVTESNFDDCNDATSTSRNTTDSTAQHRNVPPSEEKSPVFNVPENLNQTCYAPVGNKIDSCLVHADEMDPLEIWMRERSSLLKDMDVQKTSAMAASSDQIYQFRKNAHSSDVFAHHKFPDPFTVAMESCPWETEVGNFTPESSTGILIGFVDALSMSNNDQEKSDIYNSCPQNSTANSNLSFELLLQNLNKKDLPLVNVQASETVESGSESLSVTPVLNSQANIVNPSLFAAGFQNTYHVTTSNSEFFQTVSKVHNSTCNRESVAPPMSLQDPYEFILKDSNDCFETKTAGPPHLKVISAINAASDSLELQNGYDFLDIESTGTLNYNDVLNKMQLPACSLQDLNSLDPELTGPLQQCDQSIFDSRPSLHLAKCTQSSANGLCSGGVSWLPLLPYSNIEYRDSGNGSIDSRNSVTTFDTLLSSGTECMSSATVYPFMSFSKSGQDSLHGIGLPSNTITQSSLVSSDSLSSSENVSEAPISQRKADIPCPVQQIKDELSLLEASHAIGSCSSSGVRNLAIPLIRSEHEAVSATRWLSHTNFSSGLQRTTPENCSNELVTMSSHVASPYSGISSSDNSGPAMKITETCSLGTSMVSPLPISDSGLCSTFGSVPNDHCMHTSSQNSDAGTLTMTFAPNFSNSIEESMENIDLWPLNTGLEVLPTKSNVQESSGTHLTANCQTNLVAYETSVSNQISATGSSNTISRILDSLQTSDLRSSVSSQQSPLVSPGTIMKSSEIEQESSFRVSKRCNALSAPGNGVQECPIMMTQSKKPHISFQGYGPSLKTHAQPSPGVSEDLTAGHTQPTEDPSVSIAHTVQLTVPAFSETLSPSHHSLSLKLSALTDSTISTNKYLVAPVPDKRYQPCPCHPLIVDMGQDRPPLPCIPFSPALLNCQTMKAAPAMAIGPVEFIQNPHCIRDGVYEFRPSAEDIHMAQSLYRQFHHNSANITKQAKNSRYRFFLHLVQIGDFSFSITDEQYSDRSILGITLAQRMLWYKMRRSQPGPHSGTGNDSTDINEELVTTQIPFSSITGLWGQDNFLLLQLKAPPCMYLGKKKGMPYDITDGQLAKVPYHFILFQEKCARTVKRLFCHDPEFCHLLVQPVTVDLSRMFSLDSA